MVSTLEKQLYMQGGFPSDEYKAKQYEKFKPSGTSDEQQRQTSIFRWFTDFGYEPSAAEVDAFLNLAGGTNVDLERGRSMIANYVHAVQSAQEANANDPSRQVLADEKGFFNSQQQRAVKLEGSADQVYNELHSTFGKAPKLFGGLDENQINEYLDPLKSTFAQSGANTESAYARRNLTGSSTEANAIAENERKFRENVLNTGLNVGLNEQGNERQILQNRINQLQGDYQQAYGFLPGSLGRQGGVAQNIGASDMNLALLKGSLPLYLNSYSTNAAMVGRQPENQEANFFQKYIVPFIQPAATVIGGSLGGPPGAAAANLASGALLKGSNDASAGYPV